MRLLNLLAFLLLTLAVNSERTVQCTYKSWTDERGYFVYCESLDFPLSANYKHELHRFKDNAQNQDCTAIKFISSGKVEFIPEELVIAFSRLNGFILEYSDIPVFKDGLLSSKFGGLKFIEIQNNNLKEVEENAFVNTPNIEWIRLASNQIEHLNTNILKNNKKLKYIDFRNNKIKSITSNLCHDCPNIEQLLYSGSNVCTQKDFKRSDLTMKNMKRDLRVCHENYQDIGFARGTVQCIYKSWTDERGHFVYCESLDYPLSARFKNEVHRFKDSYENQDCSSVKFIASGKVDYIPDEIVTTFPKFKGFMLEYSDIPVLEEGLFTPKFVGLKFIEIQHNNLREVEENAFLNTPNIEWIRLASNQIEHLNRNIFKNKKKLKYIDFRNNKIKSITSNFCYNCRDLEQVLYSGSNVCTQKDFKKSDDTFKTIGKDLRVCFDNCQNNEMCDSKDLGDDIWDTCGQQIIGASFIYNGTEFKRGKWPWMAALFHDDEYICAGNIISKKHVITAAHCVLNKGDYQEKKPEDSFVYLGKYNLKERENGQLKMLITKFTIHPDWNPTKGTKYNSDVAVISLQDSITFTDYIQPICLNSASNSIDDLVESGNNKGIVTGWGTRENSEGKSDKAREVEVPIVYKLECLTSNVDFFHAFSDKSSFCGGKRDGSGPCRGDSGGGIYIRKDNKWTLIGMVSASLKINNDCDLNNYVIFTDVGKFDQWILRQIYKK